MPLSENTASPLTNFDFKDQTLPAHRPRGVAEGRSYYVCVLFGFGKGRRDAGLVHVGTTDPRCLPGMWRFLQTLLQNAVSLASMHSCCGPSAILRISIAWTSQFWGHLEGFEKNGYTL